MPGIRITKFGGLAPIVHEHQLNAHLATVAENIDLSRRSLRPWKVPKKINDKTGNFLWHEDCCFITSENCAASIAYNSIGCGEMLATGLYPYPVRARLADGCGNNWCRLGFPCDLPAPTVEAPPPKEWTLIPNEGGHDNHVRRQVFSYCYTLVNADGQESQPSPPSNEVDTESLSAKIVRGIPAQFPGWCVSRIRIYRSEQELTYGGDKEDIDGSFFQVGEVYLGNTEFTDNGLELGDELLTLEFDEPPADLYGIQYTNDGQYVALSGKRLMFSVRNHSHAWPQKDAVTFSDVPREIVVSGRSVFVLTDGRPAWASLQYDCSKENAPRVVAEIQEPMPIVSRRSAVSWSVGACVYASKDGLVIIDERQQMKVITSDFMSKDQWLEIKPWTMIGVVHDGHYFGFCEDYAFRIRLPDGMYEPASDISFTTLSIRPKAVHRSMDDRLFFILNDGVYEWNAGTADMVMRWQSTLFDLPGLTAFSAYKLIGKFADSKVTHWSDDRKVSEHIVTNSMPRRLPLYSGINWQIEIESSAEITEYHIASGIRDLAIHGD